MLHKFLNRTKTYKKVFETPEGKEALKFISEECGMFRSSFVPGDPSHTAFNEGKRQVFNHIMGILNQDPELVRKAIQVEQNREQLTNLEREY